MKKGQRIVNIMAVLAFFGMILGLYTTVSFLNIFTRYVDAQATLDQNMTTMFVKHLKGE